MRFFDDAMMYGRFGFGLHGFLRKSITLEQARERILKAMSQREENFLGVLKKGIYGFSESPYLPLLKYAGAEYGDIEKRVNEDMILVSKD